MITLHNLGLALFIVAFAGLAITIFASTLLFYLLQKRANKYYVKLGQPLSLGVRSFTDFGRQFTGMSFVLTLAVNGLPAKLPADHTVRRVATLCLYAFRVAITLWLICLVVFVLSINSTH